MLELMGVLVTVRERTRSQGTWISEVMVAIWLLTFIGASLIATFTFLAKGSQMSSEQAAGTLLAENLLQTAIKAGPPDWGQTQLTGTQSVVTGDSSSGTEFQWELTPLEVESARLGDFYQLTVVVRWIDRSQANTGVERGRGELRRVRHVYVEDV